MEIRPAWAFGESHHDQVSVYVTRGRGVAGGGELLSRKVTMSRRQEVHPEPPEPVIKIEEEDDEEPNRDGQNPDARQTGGDVDGQHQKPPTPKKRLPPTPPPPKLGPMPTKEKPLRYSPYDVAHARKMSIRERALPFISRPDAPYYPRRDYTKSTKPSGDKNVKTEDSKTNEQTSTANPTVDMSAFDAIFGKPIGAIAFAPIPVVIPKPPAANKP